MLIGSTIGAKIALARRNQEPEPSNITYFYDNCDVFRFGLNEHKTTAQGIFGIGLLLQNILETRTLYFIKSVDSIITPRLQNAYYQKKKFRKMDLQIQENVHGYSIRFIDIRVTSLRQQFDWSIFDSSIFDQPVVMDIVTIEAGETERNF